jgi:hypothetical protein
MAIDYDPQKAHEYYMKHRKLKGKHSTKGFSKTQKEQWAYVKDQLSTEHKEINKNITEEAKERRKALAEEAKEMISALRSRLKNMSKEEKAQWKERISNMISDIREELKSDKGALTEETKGNREQEKLAYSARKDKAYERIKRKQ